MNLKMIKVRQVVAGQFMSAGGSEMCEVTRTIPSEGDCPGEDLIVLKPRSLYDKEQWISLDSDAWVLVGDPY